MPREWAALAEIGSGWSTVSAGHFGFCILDSSCWLFLLLYFAIIGKIPYSLFHDFQFFCPPVASTSVKCASVGVLLFPALFWYSVLSRALY